MKILYNVNDHSRYVVRADGKKIGVLSPKTPEIIIERAEKIEIRECFTGNRLLDAVIFFVFAALSLFSGTVDDVEENFDKNGLSFRAETGTKADAEVTVPFEIKTEQPVKYSTALGFNAVAMLITIIAAFLMLVGVGIWMCFSKVTALLGFGIFLIAFAVFLFAFVLKRGLKSYKKAKIKLDAYIKELQEKYKTKSDANSR